MARVKYKKPRAKKVKPPKPVAPDKPVRPKRSQLKKIYRNLITTDTSQRVTALAQAMEWFDKVSKYVAWMTLYKQKLAWDANPWTTIQLRFKNALELARTQGNNTLHDPLKEKYYIKTIENFEKMVNGFKPPLVRMVLDKYDAQKAKLEDRQKKFRNRFGEFLELMRKALQPRNPEGKRIELRVDKISSPFRIDAEGNVTFDRKVVSNLRRMTRKHGMMSAALQMIPVLSEAAARVPELDPKGHKTGRMMASKRKIIAAERQMWNCLHQYQMLDPKPRKLVRRLRKKKPTVQ